MYIVMHRISVAIFLSLFLASISFERPVVSKFRTILNGHGAVEGTASVASTTSTPEPLVYQPEGTGYIMCGACKTAYVVNDDAFKNGG